MRKSFALITLLLTLLAGPGWGATLADSSQWDYCIS